MFYFQYLLQSFLHFLLLCKKCDNNHDVDTTKLRMFIKIKVYFNYEKQNCFLIHKNEKSQEILSF